MTREMILNNEKIFADEILNDAELETVNGSTCAELHELYQAMDGNKPLLKFITGVGEAVGSAVPPTNVIFAHTMERVLKIFKIDSNISVGWGGTGIRSSGNTYSRGGRPLTHEQVVHMLKTWTTSVLK